jgi:hypothetical protein
VLSRLEVGESGNVTLTTRVRQTLTRPDRHVELVPDGHLLDDNGQRERLTKWSPPGDPIARQVRALIARPEGSALGQTDAERKAWAKVSEAHREVEDARASLASIDVERAAVASGSTFLTDELGQPVGPWVVERALREVRDAIPGLPAGFRFHDLRHTYASLLIAQGLDVKTVQTRLRHASAMTTLNTYGHMFPDTDDKSREAVATAFAARRAANVRPAARP